MLEMIGAGIIKESHQSKNDSCHVIPAVTHSMEEYCLGGEILQMSDFQPLFDGGTLDVRTRATLPAHDDQTTMMRREAIGKNQQSTFFVQ